VSAQDGERRRLERNIHDGAQQQLLAMAVKLNMVRRVAPEDPDKADTMLTQLQSDVQNALEDLRDLARGIFPPLLAEKGLGAALEAQAARSPVAVTVETDGVGRYSQDVEAAVYFCSLEALQNVAKYADASQAWLRLSQQNGVLHSRWKTMATVSILPALVTVRDFKEWLTGSRRWATW
jgi:signal transduction histidine kinase